MTTSQIVKIDRYFVIEDCKELCDFYDELVNRVGEFSFLLQADGTTIFNTAANVHPLKGSRKQFIEKAAYNVKTLFQRELKEHSNFPEIGTYIFTSDICIIFRYHIFEELDYEENCIDRKKFEYRHVGLPFDTDGSVKYLPR